MVNSDSVRRHIVIELTKSAENQFSFFLLQLVAKASFVAVDLELSGLGDLKSLKHPNLEDRYRLLSLTAKSRAIVSLGLSFFCPLDVNDFQVYSFNILTACQDSYTVDPSSLQFLADNGFDFNKQISEGLLYYSGNDREEERTPFLRKLFLEISNSNLRVVLHNGFIDLIFLYQAFYADLPSSLETFVADVSCLFRGGIADTKYIADYQVRDDASFLEYLFWKRMKTMATENFASVSISNLLLASSFDPLINIRMNEIDLFDLSRAPPTPVVLCAQYASHGNCSHGRHCLLSHDIKLLFTAGNSVSLGGSALHAPKAEKLSKKQKKKMRKSLKRAKQECLANVAKRFALEESTGERPRSNGFAANAEPRDELRERATRDALCPTERFSHRAGFDAFMTGFVYFVDSHIYNEKLTAFDNMLFLSYKKVPLKLEKSAYALNSQEFLRKSRNVAQQQLFGK
ncbi:target of EGR1 protein 1-like isoform X1 [Zophobas morio]|uniref:target of EGR1 protein 1-like isoform X1 n=1 Tax=Zophobas morio TaxID=2755281 RepID=UPI0030829DC8